MTRFRAQVRRYIDHVLFGDLRANHFDIAKLIELAHMPYVETFTPGTILRAFELCCLCPFNEKGLDELLQVSARRSERWSFTQIAAPLPDVVALERDVAGLNSDSDLKTMIESRALTAAMLVFLERNWKRLGVVTVEFVKALAGGMRVLADAGETDDMDLDVLPPRFVLGPVHTPPPPSKKVRLSKLHDAGAQIMTSDALIEQMQILEEKAKATADEKELRKAERDKNRKKRSDAMSQKHAEKQAELASEKPLRELAVSRGIDFKDGRLLSRDVLLALCNNLGLDVKKSEKRATLVTLLLDETNNIDSEHPVAADSSSSDHD